MEVASDDDLVADGLDADLGQPGIGLGSILRPDGPQGGEGDRVATGLGQEVATKDQVMGPAGADGQADRIRARA